MMTNRLCILIRKKGTQTTSKNKSRRDCIQDYHESQKKLEKIFGYVWHLQTTDTSKNKENHIEKELGLDTYKRSILVS